MLTHTPAIQGHTAPSAHFTPRRSIHRLSLPPSRAPQNPPLPHTHPELYRHTQEASHRYWHSESTIVATHHGPPHGHPLPQPRTHSVQTHTHIVTVTHIDSLTRIHSKQSWSHIWIPSHTQNRRSSTQIPYTIAPPETQSPCPYPQPLTSPQRYTLRIVTPYWGLELPRLHLGEGNKAQSSLRQEGKGKEELRWSLKSEEIDNFSLGGSFLP